VYGYDGAWVCFQIYEMCDELAQQFALWCCQRDTMHISMKNNIYKEAL